uniref:Uncharacterized protein n=2 Tax=Chrysotila carterae TaxID=13221 RepID=A0A7S4BKS6_CHRCT
MYHKDRRSGTSKEGSARVGVFKQTDLTFCFALECNYNTGKIVNKLQPVQVAANQKHPVSPPPTPPRGAQLKYNPRSWKDVGKAVAIAVLDLRQENGASRLGAEGLARMRSIAAAWVRAEARKASIKAAKSAARRAKRDASDDDDDVDDDDDDNEQEAAAEGGRGPPQTLKEKANAAPAGVSALPRRPSGHLSAGPSSRVPARATVRAAAPTPRTQPVAASAPAPLQRRATAAVADVKLQPPDAAKPPARGASFTAVLARPQAFRPAHCRPAVKIAGRGTVPSDSDLVLRNARPK